MTAGSKLPGLMGEYTDEELVQHTVDHAKYFTVVQVRRGGYVSGGSNYDRHQVGSLEEARRLAADLHEADRMRGILIYAVADFAGANNFSRPVESYPRKTFVSRADQARLDKASRAEAREKARQARLTLGQRGGSTPPAPARIQRTLVDSTLPEGFQGANEALFYVTPDD